MLVAIVTIVYLVLLFGISAIAQKKQNEIVAKGGKGNFLMAGKNLPLILVAVLTAGGSIGGSNTTGLAQLVQSAGISSIWYGIASAIGLIFLGVVGAKRMRRLGYSTNAEMVADYCGAPSRYLMVIGQLIIILGVACLQYVTGGAMLASMFPGVISYEMGLVISAVAFGAVCLVGGLLGTSLANLINVVVIYVGFIICCIVAVVQHGGWNELMAGMDVVAATQTTTAGGSWMSLTGGLGIGVCLSYLVSEPGNRITTQSNTMAVAAAKNEKVARNGIVLGAILCLPIAVISIIIGLVAKVNYPDVPSAQAMATVMMSLPPAVSALGMAGLWAATVSTGVALLMSSVQLICYDILVPFKKGKVESDPVKAKKKQQNETRIVLLVLVLITLFLAFKATGMIATIITVLCITPAFFWMMISFLYFPQLIKKRSALITQSVAYIFFFIWLFIPAVKTAIPNAIYVEWPLCTVVWFLCAAFDKEPIDKVVPKAERPISTVILQDD